MLWFFTKLEKLHFEPTLAPFGSKASKQIFSQKKSFRSILSLRAAVTEKFHALIFHKTWKISFWAHFVSLLAKKLQNKVSPPQKALMSKSILSPHTVVTLFKKNPKSSRHWFFNKLQKPHFGLLLVQKLQIKLSSQTNNFNHFYAFMVF